MKLEIYNNKELTPLEGECFIELPINKQYLVSNLGRIKSKEQKVNHNYGGFAIKKERILSQTDNGSGYLSVGLTENSKTKSYRISRLVAITWINNEFNKPQVNHINGIKKDNRVENLEWNTCGENIKHSWNNNLSKKQSSFIYIQNRLKQINVYIAHIPYVETPIGLGKIIIDQTCYRMQYDNGKTENLVKSLRFWKDDFKLVLRSLSDLTKEIEINGEKFVPIDYFLGSDGDNILNTIQSNNNVEVIEFILVQKLLEWHFDIYGLIDDGLAIDINTLNK